MEVNIERAKLISTAHSRPEKNGEDKSKTVSRLEKFVFYKFN